MVDRAPIHPTSTTVRNKYTVVLSAMTAVAQTGVSGFSWKPRRWHCRHGRLTQLRNQEGAGETKGQIKNQEVSMQDYWGGMAPALRSVV